MAIDMPPTLQLVPNRTGRRPRSAWMQAARPRSTSMVMIVVAAGLLVTSAALHLDLWSSGYRSIPTIGPLFLVQGIVTPIVALVLVVTRRLIAVVASIATMSGTIGGFVLAATVGLFGFHDGFAAPFASLSFVVEVMAAVLLVSAGALIVAGSLRRRTFESPGHQVEQLFDDGPASVLSIRR